MLYVNEYIDIYHEYLHAATSLPFDSNNLMFPKSVILTEESWLSSNIFVAMVTQWLITVLPSHKVATPAIFHLQFTSSWRFSLAGSRNVSIINLDLLYHASQFSAIIAKNQNWNFGNDCAKLCVAVSEHDTQAISLSRRQCNDFTNYHHISCIAVARKILPVTAAYKWWPWYKNKHCIFNS